MFPSPHCVEKQPMKGGLKKESIVKYEFNRIKASTLSIVDARITLMKIILLLMILFHFNNAFAFTKDFMDDPYNNIEQIDINFDYSFKSTDENLNLNILLFNKDYCENDINKKLSLLLLEREVQERYRSTDFFINTYNQYLENFEKNIIRLEYSVSNFYLIYKGILLAKCLDPENEMSLDPDNDFRYKKESLKLIEIFRIAIKKQDEFLTYIDKHMEIINWKKPNIMEKLLLNSNDQVLKILSIENLIFDENIFHIVAKRILNDRKNNNNKYIIDWGDYYALMIGNSDYINDDKFVDLDSPITDIKLIGETLNSKYQFEKIQYLENASKKQILDALYDYRNVDKYNANKSLLIYYSGHGDWDETTGEGYWQASDAGDRTSTWIPNSSISRELKALPFKHIIIIADSCYSGTWTGAKSSVKEIPINRDARKKYLEYLNALSVRVALTSGNIDVVPDTLDNNPNSQFAIALNNALLLNNDDILFSHSLYDDIVSQIQYSGYLQHPTYGGIVNANHSSKGFFIFVSTN